MDEGLNLVAIEDMRNAGRFGHVLSTERSESEVGND
jgi:hypothetical protein